MSPSFPDWPLCSALPQLPCRQSRAAAVSFMTAGPDVPSCNKMIVAQLSYNAGALYLALLWEPVPAGVSLGSTLRPWALQDSSPPGFLLCFGVCPARDVELASLVSPHWITRSSPAPLFLQKFVPSWGLLPLIVSQHLEVALPSFVLQTTPGMSGQAR